MNGLFVVAGATGAIGKQLCRNIVNRGGTPILVGRSSEKLKALQEELGGGGNNVVRSIDGVDFSSPSDAGKKLSAELKGETLSGLACKLL